MNTPENLITHLPTEIALQAVDEAMNLVEGQHGEADSIRATMDRIIESFACWDRETRKTFMMALLKKEEKNDSGFSEFMKRRESQFVFPSGVTVDNYFLERLEDAAKVETFWDVCHELARDIDFTNEDDPRPNMLQKFVFNSKKAFAGQLWKEIELQLVDTFAHDASISSDGRYQVVGSYLRNREMFLGGRWEKLKDDTTPQGELERAHFLRLQEKIAHIVTDTSIKDDFRASVLAYIVYEAASPEILQEIEQVALSQGQGLHISKEILRWLSFRAVSRSDRGEHAMETIKKVVTTRTDMPAIQLEAMAALMLYDDGVRNAAKQQSAELEGSVYKAADIPQFAALERQIAAQSPEALEQSGDSFFVLLGATDEGTKFLQKSMESDVVAERLLALRGALYRSRVLVQESDVERALNDMCEIVERDGCKPYITIVIEGISYTNWKFAQKDIFILQRLANALKDTSATEDSEQAETVVEEWIQSISESR